MAVPYGFSKATILRLGDNLKPATSAEKVEIKGVPREGATASFEITGLTKTPVKVFGSNIAYFLARKGYGDVAANLGLLDVPYELDHEMAGHKRSKEEGGIPLVGNDTEPPYYAILLESEDASTGDVLGTGIFAATFGRDAYKAATITDEDFTPEPDEYVCTPVAKKLDGIDKPQIVGFAQGDAEMTELKSLLFGETTPGE